MSFLTDEAEGHPRFAGREATDQLSHTSQPSQQFTTHSTFLDGVGSHFSLSSRNGSYDASVDFSEDEAFAMQPEANITPRADRVGWLHDSPNGSRPHNSPPTPTLTPVQRLPYLPPSAMSEFNRQRAARKKHALTFDPYRGALEDTPKASPVDTAFTSLEPESDGEDPAQLDHIQETPSGGQTPSHRSFSSEEDRANDRNNSLLEQYLYTETREHLPGGAHIGTGVPDYMAMLMSGPWYACGTAPQTNGS